MMNRNARLGRLGLLTLAVILATVAFGWAGPLFAGLVFAALDGRASAPGEVALSAALAWATIVLFNVLAAGAGPSGLIGASLGVPAFVLPVVSILFSAALGWSAAALTLALRRAIAGRRRSAPLPDPGLR
jgi:hypothetical protein